MRPSSPVLIVGAGIAGLTAALALARRGIEVRLVERAARLEEVGAGVQLSPNALRVLAALDVLPSVRRNAVAATSVALKRLGDGRVLARVPVHGRDGTPYLSLLRADLQASLAEAVRAHPAVRLDLGTECLAVAREGRDAIATLGRPEHPAERVRAPILVAADGVRSIVGRELGHPGEMPSGDVAWRFMADESAAEGACIRAWLGRGTHAVAYPVEGGRRTNVVVVLPEKQADLLGALGNADADLRRLVARAGTPPSPWPLAVARRNRAATDPEGVLFVGDAAHAMLPYAAQGAAMAIEDGYVAAVCLAEAENVSAAWRRFARERHDRWRRVRRRVAFHRFVYHLPPPFDRARDVALKLRSKEALAADLSWLYDWRPPEI